MRRFRPIFAAALCAVLIPSAAAKPDRGGLVVDELPPWAERPEEVKVEIAERLVFEKKQYGTALNLIGTLRKDGLSAPVLDLLQGICMREQGMFEESERLLLSARKRTPGDGRVHNALCVLYADQLRVDEAIDSCRKATRVDSDDASGFNNLAYLLLVSDQPEEALEAAQNAIDIDPTEARYRNNLGFIQARLGETKRAYKTFNSVGTPASAYYNVGVAYERFNDDIEEAAVWYADALAVDPSHQPSLEALERLQSPDATPVADEDSE